MERKEMEFITENVFRMLPIFHATVNIANFSANSEFSRSHHEILYILQDLGMLPMSEIGRLLFVSKPYMTHLTDKLISQELVERVPDKNDRRVINLRITDKGISVFEEHKNALRKNAEFMLSCLSESELEVVSKSLQTLKELLSKANQQGYKIIREEKVDTAKVKTSNK